MRTIIIGNHKFEVRPLKRGEVKALRKDGLVLTDLDSTNAEDALERAFDMVFTPEQLAIIDDLPNPEALNLWRGILKETYGAPGEEGNSLPSGNQSQTANE